MREDNRLTKKRNMPFVTQGKINLKYILIVVVLAVIVGGGILAWQYWWVSEQGVTVPEIKLPEVKAPETSSNKAGDMSKETILNILSQGEKVPMKYEITMSWSGEGIPPEEPMVITGKIWRKNEGVRMEIPGGYGMPMLTIVRPDGVYDYNYYSSTDEYVAAVYKKSEENIYLIKSYTSWQIGELIKESTDFKILGTELIDNKLTTIVEYKKSFGEKGTASSKLWIWNEKGLPLKNKIVVEETPEAMIITVEVKNIVFGDISNSLFEIPPKKNQ